MNQHPVYGQSSQESEDQWISVSDLMAGLMIVFLFIAISYIRPIAEERRQVKDIVVAWNESETALYQALETEFADDLGRWNAELLRDSLTVRFKAPEVLFDQGSAQLKLEFRQILADFFPRYLKALKLFSDDIEEIRIEGHTDST